VALRLRGPVEHGVADPHHPLEFVVNDIQNLNVSEPRRSMRVAKHRSPPTCCVPVKKDSAREKELKSDAEVAWSRAIADDRNRQPDCYGDYISEASPPATESSDGRTASHSLNFTKGVVSPEVEARFDLPVYSAAVRTAINVKIQRTGGLKKRAGLRFVAEALSRHRSLIPFQFSDEQAYVQEFAQGTMRPLALGGAVLEAGLKVTAITKAVQCQVTAAFHGYSVGDRSISPASRA
jgi:hypothetical protein